jgi:hypothetical protein
MSTSQQTVSSSGSGKRGLIITLVIFFIPFGAAAFLHLTGLYRDMGTSNLGNLIVPPIPASDLRLVDVKTTTEVKFEGGWHIFYPMPQVCDAACRNTLTMIHQVRAALGPESDRVDIVVVLPGGVLPDGVNVPADVRLVSGEGIARVLMDRSGQTIAPGREGAAPSSPGAREGTSVDRVYLMDTMGMIFMYHDTYADQMTSLLKGKDLLRDLRHALKLSKIG